MSVLACDAALMAAFIMEAAVDNPARYENFLRHSEVDGALEKVYRLTEMAVPFVSILDQMFKEGFDSPGVFHYEVAAEYGAWYLGYVEHANREPHWPECMEKARDLLYSFYASDERALAELRSGRVFRNAGLFFSSAGDATEEHY